jgi:hypothetical protein
MYKIREVCSTCVGRNKINAEFWLGNMKETCSWEDTGAAGKILYNIVKLHVGGGRVYLNLCDLDMDRNSAFVTKVMNHRALSNSENCMIA